MNFWHRSTLLEKVALASAMLVFSASLVGLVLFEQIFAKPSIDPADVIAKVSSVTNDVKRKTPTMFEFLKIWREDPVGNGDTIFSGARSHATIQFNEGSQLSIGPDSLIVIRILDGKLDIKVEKGKITGKLKEGTEMEIQSEEESITIKGDGSSEFAIDYLPKLGFELKKVSQGNPNPTKRRESSGLEGDLDKSAPKAKKESLQKAPDTPDPVPTISKQLIELIDVKGFKVEADVKMMPKKFTLKTPYPAQGQLLFHKADTQIAIFPKISCEGNCQLDVYLDEKKFATKDFGPRQTPILYIKIAKQAAANVQWKLKDNGTETQGDFRVLEFNEKVFADSLKQKSPIEVLD